MAIIIEEGKACFFHIPKTGGMWVEAALTAGGVAWRYAELKINADARHALPWMVAEPFESSFAFRRKSQDWLLSWWRYVQQHKPGELESIVNGSKWHPLSGVLRPARRPLPEFLNLVPRCYPRRLFSLYPVDHMGRQEHLRNDLCRFLRWCEIEFNAERIMDLERINESRNRRRTLSKG